MQTTHKPVSEVKEEIHVEFNKLRTACKGQPNWNTIEPLFDRLEAAINTGLANFETA